MPMYSGADPAYQRVVCCHFMQFGECSYGSECKFVHSRADPATTMCSYGEYCRHMHGQEQDATKEAWDDEEWHVETPTWHDHGRNNKAVYPVPVGRACCHFLQYGDCSHGDDCKFDHVRLDPKVTLCGFGVNNCKFGHGWEDDDPTDHHGRYYKQNTKGYLAHQGRGADRVCCHFLEFGTCSHGDKCNFKHVRGDPKSTLCGYGKDCKHWHGHAEDKWKKPEHESSFATKSRICCYFLEWGSCAKGSHCPYEHVRGNSARIACVYGNQCRQGHGWEREDGPTTPSDQMAQRPPLRGANATGANKSNVPHKLVHAVLKSLYGRWHSMDDSNGIQLHDITPSDFAPQGFQRSMPGGGSLELACRTVDRDGTERCEPLRFNGNDIVLGKDGKFFLNVSTDLHATWINVGDPQHKLKWTRGWVNTDTRSKQKSSTKQDVAEVAVEDGDVSEEPPLTFQ